MSALPAASHVPGLAEQHKADGMTCQILTSELSEVYEHVIEHRVHRLCRFLAAIKEKGVSPADTHTLSKRGSNGSLLQEPRT